MNKFEGGSVKIAYSNENVYFIHQSGAVKIYDILEKTVTKANLNIDKTP